MHGPPDAAPDEHDAPRGGARDLPRRLWLHLVGRRSAGFFYYWLGLVIVYVVVLSAVGWPVVSLGAPVILLAVLLLGSPDPRIVAIVTGTMFGVLGYHFGLPIWLSVLIGVSLGASEWFVKASVGQLRAATEAASTERWARARHRYLLSLVAMVALVMLWGGSIYLHLLAQGDPPPFVNWMLGGVGLGAAYLLWQEARTNLARSF
jgi:hypothetical protein